jgi:hypothetical protein
LVDEELVGRPDEQPSRASGAKSRMLFCDDDIGPSREHIGDNLAA